MGQIVGGRAAPGLWGVPGGGQCAFRSAKRQPGSARGQRVGGGGGERTGLCTLTEGGQRGRSEESRCRRAIGRGGLVGRERQGKGGGGDSRWGPGPAAAPGTRLRAGHSVMPGGQGAPASPQAAGSAPDRVPSGPAAGPSPQLAAPRESPAPRRGALRASVPQKLAEALSSQYGLIVFAAGLLLLLAWAVHASGVGKSDLLCVLTALMLLQLLWMLWYVGRSAAHRRLLRPKDTHAGARWLRGESPGRRQVRRAARRLARQPLGGALSPDFPLLCLPPPRFGLPPTPPCLLSFSLLRPGCCSSLLSLCRQALGTHPVLRAAATRARSRLSSAEIPAATREAALPVLAFTAC